MLRLTILMQDKTNYGKGVTREMMFFIFVFWGESDYFRNFFLFFIDGWSVTQNKSVKRKKAHRKKANYFEWLLMMYDLNCM